MTVMYVVRNGEVMGAGGGCNVFFARVNIQDQATSTPLLRFQRHCYDRVVIRGRGSSSSCESSRAYGTWKAVRQYKLGNISIVHHPSSR